MSVTYKSTRGKQKGLMFEEVVLSGLATDKGLFVPEFIPNFTLDDIEKVSFQFLYVE
jgi:threonine synthase